MSEEPRDELSAADAAEVDRWFRTFPQGPLRRAVAEGRVRRAGYEPFAAFEDLGFVPAEEAECTSQ